MQEENIREISIHVTQKCNLNCKGCYAKVMHDDMAKILSIDDLKWIKKTFNPQKTVLLGGEPLMYEYLEDALNLFDNVTISTNGYFVPDYIDLLKEHNVFMQISIEGKKEYNDQVRAPGSYDKAIKAGKLAKENGLRCYFRVGYCEDNLEDIDWLLDNVSTKLGIPLALLPRIETPPLSIEQQIGLFDKITGADNNSIVAMPHFWRYLGKNGRCNAGSERINITYNKTITPCHLLWKYHLGEIGDPLPVINTNRKSFIKTYKRIPSGCQFCEHADECRGGCLAKPTHYGCPLKANFNLGAFAMVHGNMSKQKLDAKVQTMTALVKEAEIC